MPSQLEIYRDRNKYPDNMEWTLPSGEKTTVGEWRKELSDAFVGKDDFTRAQQRTAAERQQLESAYQQQLYQAQQQMAALQQQAARAGHQQPTSGDDLESFLADPTFAPLAKRAKLAAERAEALEQRLAEQARRLDQQEQAHWLAQHAAVLARIQERDADFRDQSRVREFLDFAKNNNLVNLDQAHRLYTRDRDIERERERVSKEAYEKAKADLSAPRVPSGANQSPSTTAPNAPTPASPDEAEEMAKNDPEIARIFEQVAG